MTKGLDERSWRSTLRLWRAREIRYVTWNRAFEPISSGVARGHIVRDVDRPALLALFADPDGPFRRPGVKILKDSQSSTVIEFDLPLQGKPCRVVYKRFRVKSWLDPITAWFRRPPALRSWIFGQGFRECGLPTPRPLAVLFRRRFGLSFEGYLLTEKIHDVQELHHFVGELSATEGPCKEFVGQAFQPYTDSLKPVEPANRSQPGKADLPEHELESASNPRFMGASSTSNFRYERQQVLRAYIDRVARLVRDLHRRQLSHRDLKAANILVARSQESEVSGEPGCVRARSQESGVTGEPGCVSARSQESGIRSQESETSILHPRSSILDPPFSIFHPRSSILHSPLSTGSVWLIDLVGVKRHRRLSRRRRVQNLARLHASFFLSTALTRTDKLRFLRTYLQWGLFGRDGWKRYWREIEFATKAKIARTTRLRRPLG